ncbi:MAG: Unknown protein [uncultured Sulfurovum sp.]|uniref:Uncharacterized protein n=1 Tax=uncultured Sulfurovum sp. TaxID=269237 RepID=A0A6S6SSC5_9BACT|nr:MAG: Unknown protein [uncultured Sulfurovum sp.]
MILYKYLNLDSLTSSSMGVYIKGDRILYYVSEVKFVFLFNKSENV